jgi:diguanylate cyclase (GGDEF)-like protein
LNNRRIFEEFLHREIKRATRYGSSFALLLLDLRKFKIVNDTYGHAAGDEVLRCVARASLEATRGSDISCRTGGDEFAILLPQTERNSAEVLAERIARIFEEYANSIAPNTAVGIDYGIAIFPEDGNEAATLFASADKALYAKKHWAHAQPATQPLPSQEMPPRIEESAPQVEAEAASGEGHPAPDAPRFAHPTEAEAEALSSDRGPSGRRDERIRLEGAPALGIVRVGEKTRTVKVLDLSRGGVCLLVDQNDLPESFPARLQVPLVPEGELTLHRVYSLPFPKGKRRVGCSFTPLAVTCSPHDHRV